MRACTLSLFFLFSLPVFAGEWILCSVRYEEAAENSAFAPYTNGALVLDIETGNAFLRATNSDGQTVTQILVDNEHVSEYGATRNTCEYDYDVSRDSNGVPTSFFISYGSCHLRRPDGSMEAVVSASEFLDFKGNRGLYQETYYQGGQTAVQPWLRFNDCIRLTP